MQKQVVEFVRVTNINDAGKLLETREELVSIINEAKEKLDEVNGMLLVKVQATDEKKLTIGGATVSLVKKLNFSKVDINVAKRYHAVKQVIDTDVLKPLYAKFGAKTFKGVTQSEYIMVRTK